MVRALINLGIDVRVIFARNIRGGSFPLDHSALWESTRDVATDISLPTAKDPLRSLRAAFRYQSFHARWLSQVVRHAMRMHRKREFHVVYSRSWPMVAHVAGYWCSKALGLPWVANTNDPWDLCYFPGQPVQPGRDRFFASLWLQRTFRHAQLLMFPSQRLANFHFRLADHNAAIGIIPHVGWSQKHEQSRNDLAGGRPLFTLVHTGKIGSTDISGRSTRGLLSALARFLAVAPEARSVVRFLVAGPEDNQTRRLVDELGLQEQVAFVGRLSYEESLKRISSASVCVLIEAKMDEGIFLPSKLIDYIAARKPILALSPRMGVAADMAAAGELLRVDPDDVPAIQAAIASLYANFQRGTLHSCAPNEAFARQFEPEVVARQFMGAVGPLLGSSRDQVERLGIAAAS